MELVLIPLSLTTVLSLCRILSLFLGTYAEVLRMKRPDICNQISNVLAKKTIL